MSGYFSTDATGPSSMKVFPEGELPGVELTAGITAAVLLGKRLNINVVTIEPKAVAPVHTHDEDQMGYIVRGSVEFTDGSRTWRLGPGDAYHAPAGAPHGATAHEHGCLIVDVFAPPRTGLAELLARAESHE